MQVLAIFCRVEFTYQVSEISERVGQFPSHQETELSW